jgi:membrane-associated phospholipid phosphatase
MATSAIEFRPTYPMVEPRALPAYYVIAIGVVASAILVPLTGFSVSPSVWPIILPWPILAFCGMLLRRVGHSKAAAATEAVALIYGQGFAFLLALFPLTALAGPLADAKLAAFDRSLGFDWTAFAWALAPITYPLLVAYKSFAWQPLVIIAVLIGTGREERLWRLVSAGAIALLITIAIYPFAPALGAFVHHRMTGYPLNGDAPFGFSKIIESIRGGDRLIRPDLFTGFVSFPSYHAAAALLFVWAAWPIRPLRWLLIPLNLALSAAALVVGGHYLIDILCGFAVGAASIVTAARTVWRR